MDLALGDPNDDGRSELVLALWKPDAGGVPRSHPFIIGYREGTYRILWDVSAVADPIHEVELGDVDIDGAQELIVLEERNDGCAVTVWRRHGWGFSLLWPEVNRGLTPPVMIRGTPGLGVTVLLAYILIRHLDQRHEHEQAGQDHPSSDTNASGSIAVLNTA